MSDTVFSGQQVAISPHKTGVWDSWAPGKQAPEFPQDQKAMRWGGGLPKCGGPLICFSVSHSSYFVYTGLGGQLKFYQKISGKDPVSINPQPF